MSNSSRNSFTHVTITQYTQFPHSETDSESSSSESQLWPRIHCPAAAAHVSIILHRERDSLYECTMYKRGYNAVYAKLVKCFVW